MLTWWPRLAITLLPRSLECWLPGIHHPQFMCGWGGKWGKPSSGPALPVKVLYATWFSTFISGGSRPVVTLLSHYVMEGQMLGVLEFCEGRNNNKTPNHWSLKVSSFKVVVFLGKSWSLQTNLSSWFWWNICLMLWGKQVNVDDSAQWLPQQGTAWANAGPVSLWLFGFQVMELLTWRECHEAP